MTEPLKLGQHNWRARMQKDIGCQLHRVVPAEILEVKKSQRSVRSAQAIVKTEIGRHKATLFLWQHGIEVKAICAHSPARLGNQPIEGGTKRHLQKGMKRFFFSRQLSQLFKAGGNLSLDFSSGQAGFSGVTLLRKGARPAAAYGLQRGM